MARCVTMRSPSIRPFSISVRPLGPGSAATDLHGFDPYRSTASVVIGNKSGLLSIFMQPPRLYDLSRIVRLIALPSQQKADTKPAAQTRSARSLKSDHRNSHPFLSSRFQPIADQKAPLRYDTITGVETFFDHCLVS